MDVKSILDRNTIKTNLVATTKDEALKELTNILLEQQYISDQEIFMEDIYGREAQGQTGIGNYIAIPHGLSSAVKKVGVAIGIQDEEIEWETLDGKGVKVIILFCVGNDIDGGQNHLKLLSMFARKLGNDEVVEALLNSETSEQVIEAFK